MCLRVASEVTFLEIPPCQTPMCGVAYSCSHVLLTSLIRSTALYRLCQISIYGTAGSSLDFSRVFHDIWLLANLSRTTLLVNFCLFVPSSAGLIYFLHDNGLPDTCMPKRNSQGPKRKRFFFTQSSRQCRTQVTRRWSCTIIWIFNHRVLCLPAIVLLNTTF